MKKTRNLVRTAGIGWADAGWRHTFEVIGDDGKGTGEFVEIVTGSSSTFRPLERITLTTEGN